MIKINCYENNELVEDKTVYFEEEDVSEAFVFMHNKNLGLRYIEGSYYMFDSPGIYLTEYTFFMNDKLEYTRNKKISLKINRIRKYFSLVKNQEPYLIELRNIAYKYIEENCPHLKSKEKSILLNIDRTTYSTYPRKQLPEIEELIGDNFDVIIRDVLVIKTKFVTGVVERNGKEKFITHKRNREWVKL